MIQQIRQKIYENKIYVIAFVGATALGVYLYFRSKQEQGQRRKKQSHDLATIEEVKGDDSEAKDEEKDVEKYANKIKNMVSEDSAPFQAVKEIFRSYYELSRSQFMRATLQNRRVRRKQLLNLQQYQKVFAGYKTELQQIHKKHLYAILAEVGISKDKWILLVNQAQAEHQEWLQHLNSLMKEEISCLRNQNKPNLELSSLIELFNFRFKVLKEKSTDFKKLFPNLKQADRKDLAQAWSADMVYSKYFVQAEDILYSQSQLSPQMEQQIQHYQENFQTLIQEIAKQQSLQQPGDDLSYLC